jgi:hypothetical protein
MRPTAVAVVTGMLLALTAAMTVASASPRKRRHPIPLAGPAGYPVECAPRSGDCYQLEHRVWFLAVNDFARAQAACHSYGLHPPMALPRRSDYLWQTIGDAAPGALQAPANTYVCGPPGLSLSYGRLVIRQRIVAAGTAASLPALPTELVGKHALEVRPAIVDFTGDGTGTLGGFTGQRALPKPKLKHLSEFGRLHWTTWNATDAHGTGAIWLDNGIPDDATGTFFPYAVEVRASRPRNGIFTRLAFVWWTGDTPHATVRSAHHYPATQYGPGYWQWF